MLNGKVYFESNSIFVDLCLKRLDIDLDNLIWFGDSNWKPDFLSTLQPKPSRFFKLLQSMLN